MINSESPCISVCQYNENDHCIGCKRHISEITEWNEYSNDMKHAINQDLQTRDLAQVELFN
jgi:predicted Fe-S protein YdhL (DUF1289 family)